MTSSCTLVTSTHTTTHALPPAVSEIVSTPTRHRCVISFTSVTEASGAGAPHRTRPRRTRGQGTRGHTAEWSRGPQSAVRRGDGGGRPQAPVRAVQGGAAEPARLPADQPVHVLPGPGAARHLPWGAAVAAAGFRHAVVRDSVADQLPAEPRAELPVARRGRRPAAGLHGGEREQLP